MHTSFIQIPVMFFHSPQFICTVFSLINAVVWQLHIWRMYCQMQCSKIYNSHVWFPRITTSWWVDLARNFADLWVGHLRMAWHPVDKDLQIQCPQKIILDHNSTLLWKKENIALQNSHGLWTCLLHIIHVFYWYTSPNIRGS